MLVMLMVNSRQKGARAERQLAKELNKHGYECRRGQQYCGANGDADVVGLPKLHIECKHVERLNIYDAMEQSEHDAKSTELPCVMHKKNNRKWLVTMPLDDFMRLYKAWERL